MAREFFKNLPNTTTPVSASRLNGLLDGDEAMGNIIVDSIHSKNMFNEQNTNNLWIDGSGNISTTTGCTLQKFSCESDEIYTISATFSSGTNATIVIAFFDNNNTLLNRYTASDLTTLTLTKTAPANSSYMYVGHYTNIPTTMQLEKGSSATTYAPFQDFDNNGIVLYNNPAGSLTTITLTDSVENYNYIEIYFFQGKVNDCVKLYSPQEKEPSLNIASCFNDAVYYKNSRWKCNKNKIEYMSGNQYYMYNGSIGGYQGSTNSVLISRVVGYK